MITCNPDGACYMTDCDLPGCGARRYPAGTCEYCEEIAPVLFEGHSGYDYLCGTCFDDAALSGGSSDADYREDFHADL